MASSSCLEGSPELTLFLLSGTLLSVSALACTPWPWTKIPLRLTQAKLLAHLAWKDSGTTILPSANGWQFQQSAKINITTDGINAQLKRTTLTSQKRRATPEATGQTDRCRAWCIARSASREQHRPASGV